MRAALAMLCLAQLLHCAVVAVTLAGAGAARSQRASVQHVYIVRHGDKYSSYPHCPGKQGQPCYDEALMGDNPPITPCGIRQARRTAAWLQNQTASSGGIQNIVVSPFTRTLQTALPLAVALGKKLKVEHLLSEAMQPEGPYREFNIEAPFPTVPQLREVHSLWDTSYNSLPIATPENNTMYHQRIGEAVKSVQNQFPPSSGNLALFTHATTAFSLAYGLCYGSSGSGGDEKLQEFVDEQDAIAPGGVIHVTISQDGGCAKVDQTLNVAEEVGCGMTDPFKCPFDWYPSWYWPHKKGKGRELCNP